VLWVFARGNPAMGWDNPFDDWKVRRLSCNLKRRYAPESANKKYVEWGVVPKNFDLVEVENILANATEKEKPALLMRALLQASDARFAEIGANDPHVRYEIAWHLAKCADTKLFSEALSYDDQLNTEVGNASVRLGGLIAIDIACYENFPSKKAALAALSKALENPGKLDHQLLLTVAQLDGDASIVPALEKLIARDDLPTATVAKAVLVLKAKSGGSLASSKLSAAAGKRLIEAVEKGSLKIASPADQLVLFEFLESEGPTPFALKQIGSQLQSNNKELRLAAHTLARRFGPGASDLAESLWPRVLNPKTKFDDAIEALSTIARVEKASQKKQWEQLLNHNNPLMRIETVRWWRRFAKEPKFIELLGSRALNLTEKDVNIRDDIEIVSRQISGKTIAKGPLSKDDLTKYTLEELADMPAADRSKRAAMGLQVFERNACTKCHTTATQTTLLAPSLKGVASQKVEYLIESVLFPSKIIKTGWEVEAIELKSGKTVSGLVKDEGKFLRVLNLDKDERVLKSDIESRSVLKVSVMPEGQEATLSRREFVDLIAYLATLN
jgi:putative heme-binding domain-containing protein